ncbi:hypothetical protein OUZ56_029644 [Daphnia magna]|uniref:Uncharacterized protein n=1 Tax=Daphnia magna TaxID=35525 RepID=A0ABR0B7E9_9CRUS|nr:hypothetical protein OUZ56_029644 [Daphnia magna]
MFWKEVGYEDPEWADWANCFNCKTLIHQYRRELRRPHVVIVAGPAGVDNPAGVAGVDNPAGPAGVDNPAGLVGGLDEYMKVMKPFAVVLDILQGDKGVFLGVGLVLPLITRLKDLLNQRVYLHLGPIRDRVLEKIDKRFDKLFEDPWYLMAALSHPCFKAHWIKDRRSQEDAKLKLRQLIQDATYSPVLKKSKTSLAEEFLVFDDIHPSGRPDDEIDVRRANFSYVTKNSVTFRKLRASRHRRFNLNQQHLDLQHQILCPKKKKVEEEGKE